MASIYKLTFFSTPAVPEAGIPAVGESVHYFADPKLIQPSLDITCCRTEHKLRWENGALYRKSPDSTPVHVGEIVCVAASNVIINEPTHL